MARETFCHCNNEITSHSACPWSLCALYFLTVYFGQIGFVLSWHINAFETWERSSHYILRTMVFEILSLLQKLKRMISWESLCKIVVLGGIKLSTMTYTTLVLPCVIWGQVPTQMHTLSHLSNSTNSATSAIAGSTSAVAAARHPTAADPDKTARREMSITPASQHGTRQR